MKPDDTMVNAYVPGATPLSPAAEALVARRARLLGPAYRLFYETPVHFTRAQGAYLYDADGNAYLDCYNNVASLGHAHPKVLEATAAQAATYASHTRYLNDVVLDCAERLTALFPPELSQAMFTCTGSEANDLALRIAFTATGGTGIVVTENAYHGVTHLMAGASPSLGKGVDLGPHVRTVPAPKDAACFAADVAAAFADLKRHGIQPAALLVDTIFSSDGVIPGAFLGLAAAVTRASGALFIADEVQPGFGRTGANWWGFQAHGVIPDMVTMGKPMGNGYPVAALVARPDILAPFGEKARYFNTFGGNAVACATAMAVIDVIESEGLMQNALTIGARLAQGLRSLPSLGETRQSGLFLGTDILDDGQPSAKKAARLVNLLREAKVLISATGPKGHVLKIRPPLILTEAQADHFLEATETALKRL